MSVFQNILKNTIENDQNQDLHLKKFICKELLEKKSLPKPFHIDCRITKKRICYCPYYEGNLITEPEKKKFQLFSYYLNNYYSGVKDHEYKSLIRKKLFIEEKIKYCQELEDVLCYMPKYNDFCSQKIENSLEKKEEKINNINPIAEVQMECFYCKTKISKEFLQIKSENNLNQTTICHDCNKALNSNSFHSKPKNNPQSSQKTKLKSENPHIHKTLLGKRKSQNVVWQNKHSYSQLKERKMGQNISSNKRICCWKNCNKSNNPEDFLICNKCDRTFHAKCSDPPLYKPLVERFSWLCNECKICTVCQRTTAEYELLICDCCDRSFHLGCLTPKRTEIPEGKWYCGECQYCACCKQKNFDVLDKMEEMEALAKQKDEKFPSTLFCAICHPFILARQYCPICCQIVPEDGGGTFIYCDSCQLWCHSECEKISKQKFKEIKSTTAYVCSRCRVKQNKEVAKT